MSKTKKTIIAVVAVVLVAAVMAGAYFFFVPKAEDGSKTITMTVIHKDQSENEFVIKTDAEYLREALEQEELISGDDSGATLYVTTVDGEVADWNVDSSWWCLADADGNMMTTGVDDTVIKDGDAFSFVYTIG